MFGALFGRDSIQLSGVDDRRQGACPWASIGEVILELLPVVLSGGSGTRLWPLSREKYPKQLLPLVGELSMLQDTVRRLDGFPGLLDPLVVCNEEHRFVVAYR